MSSISDRLLDETAVDINTFAPKNLFEGIDIDTDADNRMETKNHTRSKRQSLGRSSLCDVNTQFITPQAALNNRGKRLL